MNEAEKYAELFRKSDFRATVDFSKDSLKDTVDGAFHDCSDGRGLLATVFEYMVLGPHTLGATPGLANHIALASWGTSKTNLKHVNIAIDRVKRAGFEPGWHDINRRGVHCGQQGKMAAGEIYTLPKQEFSPLEAAELIATRGGVSLDRGDRPHKEKALIFNLIPYSTRMPDADNQMFDFDKWFLDLVEVKIPPHVLVASIAETIKLLSPVRDVRIMVEG